MTIKHVTINVINNNKNFKVINSLTLNCLIKNGLYNISIVPINYTYKELKNEQLTFILNSSKDLNLEKHHSLKNFLLTFTTF